MDSYYPETETLYLEGDWTISGVTQQQKLLVNQLATIRNRKQNGNIGETRIDLHKIETSDASGLQLLTALLAGISEIGLKPVLVNAPGQVRACAELVGCNAILSGLTD